MLTDQPAPLPERELRLRLAHLVRRYAYAANLSPNALMVAPGSIQALATTPTSTDVAEQATAYWSASALGYAGLQLRAAVDHLRGLADLLTRSPAVLPAIAVSRSVIEASARAAALARPDLDRRQRAARGLAETLYDWAQQQTLPSNAPESWQPLLDRALIEAQALAFKVSAPRRRPRTPSEPNDLIDPVPQLLEPYMRPGATEAIEVLLLPISSRMGRVAYELWSAAAHATPHGLLALAADSDSGIIFHPEEKAFVSTVAATCAGFSFAYSNRLACTGADASRWTATIQRLDAAWAQLFAARR